MPPNGAVSHEITFSLYKFPEKIVQTYLNRNKNTEVNSRFVGERVSVALDLNDDI